MDTENTLGRMEEYMRDFGFKVNSMEMIEREYFDFSFFFGTSLLICIYLYVNS